MQRKKRITPKKDTKKKTIYKTKERISIFFFNAKVITKITQKANIYLSL